MADRLKYVVGEDVWVIEWGKAVEGRITAIDDKYGIDVLLKNGDGTVPGSHDGSVTDCGLKPKYIFATKLQAEQSLVGRWKRIRTLVEKAIEDLDNNFDNEGYIPERIRKLERHIREAR